MESEGPASEGKEGVFQYLRNRARDPKPFFLVIALVNPHDVLFYPSKFVESTYSESLLYGDVQLPATYNESLSTKPEAQRQWAALSVGAQGEKRRF